MKTVEGKSIRIKAKNVPTQIKDYWNVDEEMDLVVMLRAEDSVLSWRSVWKKDGTRIKDEDMVPDVVAKAGTAFEYLVRRDNGMEYNTNSITNLVGYNMGDFNYLFEKI